jgi:hypothetical protein
MIGLRATGATMRSGPLMSWLSFSTEVSYSTAVMAGLPGHPDWLSTMLY